MISRRAFMAGSAFMAASSRVMAQARTHHIVLLAQGDEGKAALIDEFARLGYTGGKNFKVTTILAPNQDDYDNAAREAIRQGPDVIIVFATELAFAVKGKTTTIPIVATAVSDPLRTGLVSSLSRPGGNLTAISSISSDLLPKRLALLKEALPGIRKAAIVFRSDSRVGAQQMQIAREAAGPLGIDVMGVALAPEAPIEDRMAASRHAGAEALVMTRDPYFTRVMPAVAASALQLRMPSVGTTVASARLGLMCGYGADTEPNWRLAARFADWIMRGENAGDIPVEQPTRLRFAVNAATARILGVTLPVTLLAQADEVIE